MTETSHRTAYALVLHNENVDDVCARMLANAVPAPSLSSASPIEPVPVSTKGFNRLSRERDK